MNKYLYLIWGRGDKSILTLISRFQNRIFFSTPQIYKKNCKHLFYTKNSGGGMRNEKNKNKYMVNNVIKKIEENEIKENNYL